MNPNNNISWKRLFVEAFAIVASILFAFAIDAWWEDRLERNEERNSLELILRDLQESEEQLNRYALYAASASQSGIDAYMALSSSGPYDRETIRNDMMRVDRYSVRVPKAAYTEILSTGRLRVIADRALRDHIVQFYENAERSELIILKNNDAYLDRLLGDSYYASGLLLPYSAEDMRVASITSANQLLLERIGTEFQHLPDPMWDFPADSREWQKLRSALLYAAQIHILGELNAKRMINEASLLADEIEHWLAR